MHQKATGSANTMAKGQSRLKAAKWQALKKRTQKALRSLTTRAQRPLKIIRNVVAIGGVLWSVYQGTLRTVPAIHPDPAVSLSWEDLPITAANPGQFFKLHDARFFCEVTNITWHAEGREELMRAISEPDPIVFEVDRPPATINPGETDTFPCSLSLNATVHNKYTGVQLPIVLIHMRIRAEYTIDFGVFQWKRTTRSQLFTWRWVSGGFQWLEGDSSDRVEN